MGSHVCERYIAEGWQVVCMDNLSTGSADNVAHLMGHPRFRFVYYDVTQYLHVKGRLDLILHFASPASPRDYLQMPIQTLKVGSLGTHKSLGLAKAKGARYVLASTSEVYGDPQEHPQSEEYWGHVNPVGLRGVYDEAKRFAEAMVMAYHRHHGLKTHIARIFNTYGPRMRMRDGRALPAFLGQALRGEPLTVFGDGSQTRSFMYVDDLVEGIYRLSQSECTEPVNLGNPEEVAMGDFAREVCALAGSQSEVVQGPLPEGDPQVRRPDIARARKELGWEPKVSRADGLTRTMVYVREILSEQGGV